MILFRGKSNSAYFYVHFDLETVRKKEIGEQESPFIDQKFYKKILSDFQNKNFTWKKAQLRYKCLKL